MSESQARALAMFRLNHRLTMEELKEWTPAASFGNNKSRIFDDFDDVPVQGPSLASFTSPHKKENLKKRVKRLLRSPGWDIGVGLVIIYNSVLMGVETNCKSLRDPKPEYCENKAFFTISEHVTLIAFTVELLLQSFAQIKYLKTPQGSLDAAIVIIGVVDSWILEPLVHKGESSAGRTLLLARILRLLRLTRVMRLMKVFIFFPELWIMMRSLVSAVKTIFWGFLLTMFLVFIFSIVAVESFGSAGDQWNSMWAATMTLLQVATLDSWTSVMKPLMVMYPVEGTLFAVVFVCVVSISMMNLIAAILTERSIKSAEDDAWMADIQRLERLKQFQMDLLDIFEKADTDCSGEVSKKELTDLWNQNKHVRHKLENFGKLEEILDLFDLINCDSMKDSLSCEHFLDGMVKYNEDRTLYLTQQSLKHIEVVKRRIRRQEAHIADNRLLTIELAKAILPPPGTQVKSVARIAQEYEESQQKLLEKKANLVQESPEVVKILADKFNKADSSKNGELELTEISCLFPEMNAVDLKSLFQVFDVDNSGTINFDEFLAAIHKCKKESIDKGDISCLLEDARIQAATITTFEADPQNEDIDKSFLESRLQIIVQQAVAAALDQTRGGAQAMVDRELERRCYPIVESPKESHAPLLDCMSRLQVLEKSVTGLEKSVRQVLHKLEHKQVSAGANASTAQKDSFSEAAAIIADRLQGLERAVCTVLENQASTAPASAAQGQRGSRQGPVETFHGGDPNGNATKSLLEAWREYEEGRNVLDKKVSEFITQIGNMHVTQPWVADFPQPRQTIPRQEWGDRPTQELCDQVQEMEEQVQHLCSYIAKQPSMYSEQAYQGSHDPFYAGQQFVPNDSQNGTAVPQSVAQNFMPPLRPPPMVEFSAACFHEAASMSQSQWPPVSAPWPQMHEADVLRSLGRDLQHVRRQDLS